MSEVHVKVTKHNLIWKVNVYIYNLYWIWHNPFLDRNVNVKLLSDKWISSRTSVRVDKAI